MIRVGIEADIVKVSRLWKEMVNEMKPGWSPNVEWWRDIAVKCIRAGSYFILVNEEGGVINGFLDLFIYNEPSTGKRHAVGQHFFIVKESRDTGLAQKLYNAAIAKTKEEKAVVLELFCFDEEMPLWEKKGYRKVRTLMRMENDYV